MPKRVALLPGLNRPLAKGDVARTRRQLHDIHTSLRVKPLLCDKDQTLFTLYATIEWYTELDVVRPAQRAPRLIVPAKIDQTLAKRGRTLPVVEHSACDQFDGILQRRRAPNKVVHEAGDLLSLKDYSHGSSSRG